MTKKLSYISVALLAFAILGLSTELAFGVNNAGIGLTSTLIDLCGSVRDLIPTVTMLLVVTGAVIYAAGQVMGAETRSRANVWATAMLVGAVMSVLITAVTPSVLSAVYSDIKADCSSECRGTTTAGVPVCFLVPSGGSCCLTPAGFAFICPSSANICNSGASKCCTAPGNCLTPPLSPTACKL